MAEDLYADWPQARLIPATGIHGKKEQEERSTSALLSVMEAVPSFGHSLLGPLGAPKGRLLTFTEPRFETKAGGTAIPDGSVVIEWGKKQWVCLVEVKTGDGVLDDEQIDRYVQIAADRGFDMVLTVSNDIVADPSESPVKVDGRHLRRLPGGLRHLSWFRIHTEAVIESQHRRVEDPDQARILEELIAFLDDERSGASWFDGMGSAWVRVRDSARNQTLKRADSGVRDVAERWEAFVEYASLRLYRELGKKPTPRYPRGSTHRERIDTYVQTLGDQSLLDASIGIPGAAAPIDIEVDLRSRQVTTSARIRAPEEHRPVTRVNWLLRQLKEVPDDLRIEVRFPRTRATTALLVGDAKTDPSGLLLPEDPKKPPNAFEIALTRDMGPKNGKGRGSFVASTMEQIGVFYGQALENVRPWTAPPPKLPKPTDLIDEGEPGPIAPNIVPPPQHHDAG